MASEQEPEPGDLIEVFRSFYQHWAVYVGDGYVVHLVQTGGGSSSSSSSSSMGLISAQISGAMVRKEKLRDVVGKDKWKINNNLDKKYKPRPACDIVKEACAMVGREMRYRLMSANCEHFATELRYGKAESRQARKVGEAIVAATMEGRVSVVAMLVVVPVARAVSWTVGLFSSMSQLVSGSSRSGSSSM